MENGIKESAINNYMAGFIIYSAKKAYYIILILLAAAFFNMTVPPVSLNFASFFEFKISFVSPAEAASEDFLEYLSSASLGRYIDEYPGCFFAPVHSPAAPLSDSPKTLAAVIMPLLYRFNEKYPLYPPEADIKKNNDDNFSKYIPKIDNLSSGVRLKIILDHLCSPFLFCDLDLLSNITFAWHQNFYMTSIIKHETLPVAVTIIDGGLNIENSLLYYLIDTDKHSIYLMYSPFAPASDYAGLTARTLVYNKKEMSFYIRAAASASEKTLQYHSSSVIVLIHDLKNIISKFDKFNKMAEGAKFDFTYMYGFLKMQIEKKVIKEDAKLKSYRFYHFLSNERRQKLVELIKNIKSNILEPELATYSNRFAALKPLQIEMAEKNKDEQQRAILKKFSLLNEKIQKMNIKLTPKREYDVIFRKLNIGNY